MKRLIYLSMMILGFILMSNSGCDETEKPSADRKLQNQTEVAASEANRQVGMPSIINFQEKKNLKWIYELCDQEEMICYAYLMNEMDGKIGQYLGKCIGYGIPYSTQFSNPEKVVQNRTSSTYGYLFGTMPQAEPNQLFKPEGLSATWLIMIDPESGKPRPVYVEPAIIVSPFKMH